MGLIVVSFAADPFGMILDRFPIVPILYRCISIAVVFFLAIRIFVYHKTFSKNTATRADTLCADAGYCYRNAERILKIIHGVVL